ncbi:unnamed protein product [Symbiodinium natans]|uniref:Uncharacterized protein n=1 Tax=Symbiodinium natans TaxID=878477 RepID=A0A812Q3I4_9DINO|nr:unnamed protein product [Symbiodinium natans]
MAGENVVHNEYILLVVVGIILFGLCTGVCAFTWRNRRDLWLLIAIPLKLGPGHDDIEKATTADRIVYERAEQRRREREEREEALREAADPGQGSDDEAPVMPHQLEEGRRSRTGSKGSTTAGTDSRTSQAVGKHRGRKSSRASDPGIARRHLHEGDLDSRPISLTMPPGGRKMGRVSPLDVGDAEDPLSLSDSTQVGS